MAEILSHPSIGEHSTEETFNFPDGSSVTLRCGDTGRLTFSLAVYLLEDVKFQLMMMARE